MTDNHVKLVNFGMTPLVRRMESNLLTMPTAPKRYRPPGYKKPADTRPNSSERGYGWLWQKQRKHDMCNDPPICAECLKEGVVVAGTQRDHIVPKADGGGDDITNLQWLCDGCHFRKSANERNRRRQHSD